MRTSPPDTSAPDEKPAPPEPKGPLSGFWQTTTGAVFRVTDDGTTALFAVIPNNLLQYMSGKSDLRGRQARCEDFDGHV